MNQLVDTSVRDRSSEAEYITVTIAGKLFGIPVSAVRDVLAPQRVTPIPLAPPEIAGSLNLRGRVVTALDARLRLGLAAGARRECMSVVVDSQGELFSILVDSVGEVIAVSSDQFEANPPNLDPVWKEFSQGIYRQEDFLLTVLDVAKLLDLEGH